MKFIFLVFALLGAFAACSYESEREYIILSDKISKPFEKKVEKEKGFTLFISGGSFLQNVEGVGMGFMTKKYADVSEARALFVELMEEVLGLYNNNEEIRKYLEVYPFQPENVELILTFKNDPLDTESVYAIQMMSGKVFFTFSAYNDPQNFSETYSETYRHVYGHDRPTKSVMESSK